VTNAVGRPGATAGSLIRITISHNDRRLDIGVPTHTPLAEHMPGFVRHLGALDPTLVYGGYRLQRADGSTLSTDRTLVEQDVQDGDLLTLVAGALQPEVQIYDDVVEAVGDAVGRQQAPWTPADSARTALAASTAFLVIGAVLLASSADHGFGALVAGAGAALIVTVAAVLSRVQQPIAGLVLALTATLYGAVCGLLLAPTGEFWGFPIAGAGAGAIVVGFIGAAVIARYRDFATIIAVAGVFIGIAGSIVAFTGAPVPAVYGLTLAIAGTLGNGIPWLALSSSRITVISPHNDQEIFITPPPVDAGGTAARTAVGHRLLLAGRISLTIVAFVATPAVVGLGIPGALLCALVFVGLMTSARKAWARGEVLAIMSTGLAGIVLTGTTAAIVQPEWRTALVLILSIAAALLVGLTLLGTRTNLRVARIADSVDVFSLALLLPLGVIVAGIA
jgi:type VII secretion integral membrane protein EccD